MMSSSLPALSPSLSPPPPAFCWVAFQTDAVATALEATGSALGFFGGWLRDRLNDLLPPHDQQQQQATRHQQDAPDRCHSTGTAGTPRGGSYLAAGGISRGTGKLLQSALMVAVMVVVLVVLRRWA